MAISKEQLEQILDQISGGDSVSQACLDAKASKKDLYRWANKNEENGALLSRAREEQQHALVDEMRELADSCDESNVNSTKLKIWQRQWNAARCAPRKYGDKTAIEVAGKDGGPLVVKWEK